MPLNTRALKSSNRLWKEWAKRGQCGGEGAMDRQMFSTLLLMVRLVPGCASLESEFTEAA